MRKSVSLLFVFAMITLLPAGCGNSAKIGTCTAACPADVTPVSITMTDDPPSGVSVLFFQVSLTAASLTPASGSSTSSPVSLLPYNTPIEVDVTKLQALSAFLNAASVPPGSYSSLNLTFANPQLVIVNNSDTAIASTCAAGSICELTPTIDNSSTLTFSSSPFPVTVASGSPLGFLIDFHLNTVIQPDLSVNLGAANGVTVGQISASAPSGPPRFGFITGSVVNVSPTTDQFTIQTPDLRSFIIGTSSTAFNGFPSSACATPSISCLVAGQVVRVQVSGLVFGGLLTASQVTYVQAASQQTIEGTIVAIPPLPLPAGETIVDLILHQGPESSSAVPLGGIAQVAVWGAGSSNPVTTFSVDTQGFTGLPTSDFINAADLTVGQEVQVTAVPGSLQTVSGPPMSGVWGPPPQLSLTASNVQLEPGQFTGTISSIGSPSFTLNIPSWPQCVSATPSPGSIACPDFVGLLQRNVETTSQTAYQGFTPDDFSGLADNDLVSVSGWLFAQNGVLDPAVGPPYIVAQTVALHSNGAF